MERIRLILISLVILMTIESGTAFLKMDKKSKLVQTLLGKKPNQPQKPDRNCPGGKMNVVGECAAQYKHGDMNSCTPQGKEIIWAEVHTLVSDPKAGCKYQPGGIKADHAPGDGPVFTYSKTAITVAGGCRANFWICYKTPDDSVDYGCPAHWWICNNYCNKRKCVCGGICSRYPKRHRGRSCVCMGCPKYIKDEPRTCTCKGDPHLTTFDGSKYTLGEDWVRRDKRSLVYDPTKPACPYYLMKGTDIDVILHNVHCKNGKDEGQSRATCVDHIIIQCNNVQYELRHNKKVYIGGIEQPLPFEGSEKGCSFGEDETHVTIECKGTLTGKWNGVQIALADDSDDNTEGICGKKEGKVNVEIKDELENMQQWKVDPKCKDQE